jgi:hypothetical protein
MHGDTTLLGTVIEWVSPVEGHGSRDRRLSARPIGFFVHGPPEIRHPASVTPYDDDLVDLIDNDLIDNDDLGAVQLLAEPGQRDARSSRDASWDCRASPISNHHHRDIHRGRMRLEHANLNPVDHVGGADVRDWAGDGFNPG